MYTEDCDIEMGGIDHSTCNWMLLDCIHSLISNMMYCHGNQNVLPWEPEYDCHGTGICVAMGTRI